MCVFLGCSGGEPDEIIAPINENTNTTDTTDASTNKASIEYDSNGCLNTHNAEAVINDPPETSTVSQYKWKTLIWNCADYQTYNDKHIEKLLISEDGGICYQDSTVYPEDWIIITDGDCTQTAGAPTVSNEKTTLTNFQMTFVNFTSIGTIPENCQNCYAVNYQYSATIQNTGNVTLWGSGLDITSQAGSMGASIFLSPPIPTGGLYQINDTGMFLFSGPGTYDLKVELRDVTLLNDSDNNITFDSMTTTIVVP